MKCAKPVTLVQDKGLRSKVVPCGQCMPCRINTRRKKTARFLLEGSSKPQSSFLTLTYDPEHLPIADDFDGEPQPTLVPKHLQLFIKRLRRAGHEFRFVGVGEYGTRYGRPHYHALIFGCDPHWIEEDVERLWGRGSTQTRNISPARMAYCAGYTTKKLTKAGATGLGTHQHPEFMRQSLNPAIGYGALDWLESLHYTSGGSQILAETGDVSSTFRLGGKIWPLDQTMRRKLRERLGVPRTDPRRQAGLEVPEVAEQVAALATHERMLRRRRSAGEVF